jgi:nicotinamide riboside kinase
MRHVVKIALLGAESTGKTQLAENLAMHLTQEGAGVQVVHEYLREWVQTKGRTPQLHEQSEIALVQRLRIEQAVRDAFARLNTRDQEQKISYVIADTTPLMTAVYSELIFQDTQLQIAASSYQRSFDLSLLTGLDIPWQADGMQRDGPQVRPVVDTLLRRLLQQAHIPYEVIYGQGQSRLQSALNALQKSTEIHSITACETQTLSINPTSAENKAPAWAWACDKCSDPRCEHMLFSQVLKLRHAAQ